MKKNSFWIIIFLLTLIISWLFESQKFGNQETHLIIPIYLGRVFGYLLFPLIIAFIFNVIAKLLKKEFSKKSFRTTFTVIWSLLLLSGLTNFLYDSSNSTLYQNDFASSQNGRNIYSLEGNEYSVSFREEPTISESSFLINDLTSEIAELVMIDDQSYVQSESFLYTDEFSIAIIDKDYVFQILEEYSKYNGILYSEFGYEENEMGKIGTLRGFKTLKDINGYEIETTFRIVAYFGNRSAIILHGRSPSSIYPTPEIITFLNSIEKNK